MKTKNIKDTKRFLVGWGRQGNRMVFFIAHSELPETDSNPIVCNPDNFSQTMIELANRIDKSRGKI